VGLLTNKLVELGEAVSFEDRFSKQRYKIISNTDINNNVGDSWCLTIIQLYRGG
jgi:hypothetical protein